MDVSIQAGSQAAAAEASRTKNLKKAASACFIGNFVEWFDYAAYGYLAAVIAAVFSQLKTPW